MKSGRSWPVAKRLPWCYNPGMTKEEILKSARKVEQLSDRMISDIRKGRVPEKPLDKLHAIRFEAQTLVSSITGERRPKLWR